MTRARTLFLIIAVIGLHQGFSVAKQCTAQGKYPNDRENSCAGYTMCLIAGGGLFAQYNLSCPAGFIFNHALGQCTNVTGYDCQPLYNCTHVGNFLNPFKEDCASYIACVEGFNDIITARAIDCPENHTFSLDRESCVNETVECYNKEQDSYIEHVLVNVSASMENSGYTKSLSLCTVLIYLVFISIV